MNDAARNKILTWVVTPATMSWLVNSIEVKIALCTSLDFSQFLDILVTSHDSCLESLNQKIVLSAYVPCIPTYTYSLLGCRKFSVKIKCPPKYDK